MYNPTGNSTSDLETEAEAEAEAPGSGHFLAEAEAPRNMALPLPICLIIAFQILVAFRPNFMQFLLYVHLNCFQIKLISFIIYLKDIIN